MYAEDHDRERLWAAPINSRLNVVVRSPTPFGLGQNGCWTYPGSQLLRALDFVKTTLMKLMNSKETKKSLA